METYKVARATARQGLSVVINEGLAVPSGSWSADAANRDLQVDGVDVGRGRAPDHVRALLGLDDSTTDVIRRATRHWRRRHLRSGAEARHTPDKFRKDLRARMPLAEEAERLQLPPSTPVVEITRTEYAAHGTPVEVNEMTADAGSYVFRHEFAAAG
jgi:GntR family transcriptional regulator